MPPVLQAQELKKHYQMGTATVRALDGVTLTVEQGEFLALLGTSGSGKSTLLNLVAGLDRATGGTLRMFDQDLAAMTPMQLTEHRRRNVGIIFQSFNLVTTMSAVENVALAMMFAGVPRAERDGRATALLEAVGRGGRQRHRPRELSGGEQQRVAIARALSNRPQLLLADEPTGNLDEDAAVQVVELLETLPASHGCTLVLVPHTRALAAGADRRLRLRDGVVLSEP